MTEPNTDTANTQTEGDCSPATCSPIPETFYRGEHPKAADVGALKVLLNLIPDSMPLRAGFREGAKLVVYNRGTDDEHLEIIEPDDDEDDY